MDSFLEGQADEGETVDEMTPFTVSSEEALRKLASYQLPFEGAWILKMVQALVAGGTSSEIVISATSEDLSVCGPFPSDWVPESIMRAFLTPEPSEVRSLQHLVVGLRVVGLEQKCPFEIHWADGRRLLWDGESFELEQAGAGKPKIWIALPVEVEGWLKRGKAASRRNAAMTRVLREGAFVCPLPIYFDGLQVSSLGNCPSHEVSKESVPISVLWSRSRLPLWLPPGMSLDALRKSRREEFRGLQEFREGVLGGLELPSRLSTLAIVSAHVTAPSEDGESDWSIQKGRSVAYWIDDGVVVHTENLPLEEQAVSMALMLSAEGLKKDLTTFAPLDGPAKLERVQEAMKSVLPQVEKMSFDALPECYEAGGSVSSSLLNSLGGAFLGGVGGLFLAGFSPLVMVFVGAGAATAVMAGKNMERVRREIVDLLIAGHRAFCEDLRAAVGGGD